MNEQEIKAWALRIAVEEHLYKEGESDTATLANGVKVTIAKMEKGWKISYEYTKVVIGHEFPTLSKCLMHLFQCNGIKW